MPRWALRAAAYLAALVVCLSGAEAQQPPFQLFGTNSTMAAVVTETAGISLFNTIPPSPPPPVLVYTNSFLTTCAPSGWTFTRASIGWDWNNSGVLTSYAIDAQMCPAYYDKLATNYGIGFWSTRQNRWANSATPATQTQTIPTGTYALSVVGSGSLALTGGSATCTPSCTVTDGNPAVVNNPGSASLTGTVTGSLSLMQIESCSGSIIAVCAPSAPISSTAAFPTRQPDRLFSSLTNLSMGSRRGTLIQEVIIPVLPNVNSAIAYLSTGTGANTGIRLLVRATDHKLQAICEIAGVSQGFAVSGTAVTAGTTLRIGLSWDTVTGFSVSFNGNASSTRLAGCNPSTALARLNIGSDAAFAFQIQGYVQSVKLYDSNFGPSDLQVLTSFPDPSLNALTYLSFLNGQSLSVGRITDGSTTVVTTTPPYPTQLWTMQDRWTASGPRLIYNYLSFSNPGITGLIPGIEVCGQIPPFNCADWGETGAVTGGAQRIFMGSTQKAVVRSNGAGSTLLSAIAPGTNPFDNMVNEATVLNGLITGVGGTLFVPTLHFIHGETDRSNGTSYATYFAGLANYSSNFITQMKGVTGQVTNPILYFTGLSPSPGHSSVGSEISLAQYDAALGPSPISGWRFCVSGYVFPYSVADGLHRTAANYAWQGEYQGYCEERDRIAGTSVGPTYITAAAFVADTSHVDLTWNVPTGNITLDSGTNIGQGVAYKGGLQYIDSCILANPTAPYTQIDTYSVTAANKISYTLTVPADKVGCSGWSTYVAYNPPGLASQTAMPTVLTGGTSGIPGPCVITVSVDPSNAQTQASYNATIGAGGDLTSVDTIAAVGLYAPQVANLYNGVAVTGCSLSGATVNSVRIQNTYSAGILSSAWSSIRDQNTTLSRLGNKLYNWAVTGRMAITGP